MKPGDRVRLSERGVRAFTATIMGRKRRSDSVDWQNRCGTIFSVSSLGIRVTWDGRKYPADHLPERALQIIG